MSGALNSKPGFLYIDDNPADVQLFRLALNAAKLDCDLTVFEDGCEMETFISKQGAYLARTIPDLIVMDWHLAGASSEEVLRMMRSNRDFADVPVVILTSGLSPLSTRSMGQFHISRCITKPSDLDAFLNIGMVLKELLIEERLNDGPT